MTFVVIWRYINKTELNWIELSGHAEGTKGQVAWSLFPRAWIKWLLTCKKVNQLTLKKLKITKASGTKNDNKSARGKEYKINQKEACTNV